MLFWFIKQIIISLTLILLIHYLYIFFKTNLTEPKIKDLVKKPMKRYIEMYQTIDNQTDTVQIDSNDNAVQMKDELKNYLQTLTSKKNDPMSASDLNNNFQTL